MGSNAKGHICPGATMLVARVAIPVDIELLRVGKKMREKMRDGSRNQDSLTLVNTITGKGERLHNFTKVRCSHRVASKRLHARPAQVDHGLELFPSERPPIGRDAIDLRTHTPIDLWMLQQSVKQKSACVGDSIKAG